MMRSARQTLVVARKEIIDGIRDRRSLRVVLFSALFGPILVGFMLNQIATRERAVEEVRVPVVGVANAPALVEWLRQQEGVTVAELAGDAEQKVRDKKEDVVVVIPDDFVKKFRASKPAPVKIVSDGSNTSTRAKVQRVRALVTRYNSEIASLRLIARGVSPAMTAVVQVQDIEVSSSQQRAAMILNFLPMFIIVSAFAGGMQIAIDATAGERERGSLEPLLVNPVARGAIATGKVLAATLLSAVSVVVTTALCISMLRYIPLQDLGMRFHLGAPEVAGMLAVALPLCLLAAALQLCLSTFARSFKEAQSYMGFLMLVPTVPGVFATLNPINSKAWMYAIPLFGQQVALIDVLGGKFPAPWQFVMAAAITIAAALLLTAVATRLLRREKIIFGR